MGKDVVVLMHLYKSVYEFAAVQRLSKSKRLNHGKQKGVVALIYISAVIPIAGKSCLDIMGATIYSLPPFVKYNVSFKFSKQLLKHLVNLLITNHGKQKSTGIVYFTSAKKVMYYNLEKGKAKKWMLKLNLQSINAINTLVAYFPVKDTFYKGKLGYIICGNDKVITVAGQTAYVNMAGIKLKVLVQKASYAFWATACDGVVNAAINLIKKIQTI